MSIEEMVANLRLPVSSFLSKKLLWCALLEMYRVQIICFLMLGCSGGVGLQEVQNIIMHFYCIICCMK